MPTTSPFSPYCLEVFKQSPLFSDIQEDQLAILLQGFKRETWSKESRIEVNTLERFFIITRGRVELVRTDTATGRRPGRG